MNYFIYIIVMTTFQWINKLYYLIDNHLFPCRCFTCYEIIETQGLCGICWKELEFITNPCICCGSQVPYSTDAKCTLCLKENLPFINRSLLHYNKQSKKLILPFKHGDRLDIGIFFAEMMNKMLRNFIYHIDTILPVPLHWIKTLKRRYNQSALLAQYIAKKNNILYSEDILIKPRYAISQGTMNKIQRKNNVKNTFIVNNSEKIQNKNVLIIDDLYASGATLKECVHTILKYQPQNIYTFTIGKTK